MAKKINLDTASRVDVICRKGDTFKLKLTITDSDGDANFAENDVFLFEVRESDTGSIVQNTSSEDFSDSHTATSDEATAKAITLEVSASVMKTMPAGLYVYDVEQKSGSTVTTLIYGTLKVNEDVSITA